jgi:hypothetical protein
MTGTNNDQNTAVMSNHARERGTLQRTLPNPTMILVIFFTCCTAIASCICLYSSSNDSSPLIKTEVQSELYHRYSIDSVVEMILKIAAGVCFSIVALLYRDSSVLLPVINFIIVSSPLNPTKRMPREKVDVLYTF